MMTLVLAALPASAADSYREFSFVVDNKTDKDVRFVVESEWSDGRKVNPFHQWVPAKGGAGFNLANGDLHDPTNAQLGNVRIVQVKLDNIDNNKVFKTVDMTDMFGNRPNKMIDSPAHFIVEQVGNATIVRRFLCTDGRGGW